MKVKINKKEYTIKIGARALMSLRSAADKVGELTDDETFDMLVDLAWAGIREKGTLKKEQLEDAIDSDLELFKELMGSLSALNGLDVQAKKPTAK